MKDETYNTIVKGIVWVGFPILFIIIALVVNN